MERALVSLHPAIGSIEAYIARVNAFALLSAEEEREIAQNLKENNDLESARILVLCHLRYVVRIAKGYTGYGLPLADLIQEGNIGLMKAVKRFDPAIGVRLISFAVHWIKAEIHDYVLKNWRIVKMATTKAQRKLFFKLRNMKKRLGWFNQEEIETVAQTLNVSPKEVLNMEARLNAADLCFDAPSNDEEHENPAPAAYLCAENSDPAEQFESLNTESKQKERLIQALDKLDPRSLDIIQQRFLNDNKATLQDLSAKYAISQERVRQLEQNALKKLRENFT